MLYLPDVRTATQKIEALQDEYQAKFLQIHQSTDPLWEMKTDALLTELKEKLYPLLEEQAREMRGR